MFPLNENRNEGTFGCSPRTKTGTKVRSHVSPERKNEGTFAKTTLLRNRPFEKLGEFAWHTNNRLKGTH